MRRSGPALVAIFPLLLPPGIPNFRAARRDPPISRLTWGP
jgi:hypothetical protein